MADKSTPPPPAATPGSSGTAKKEKKAKPANIVIPQKKPKLSKAERRELQERQRAAKAVAKPQGQQQKKKGQQQDQSAAGGGGEKGRSGKSGGKGRQQQAQDGGGRWDENELLSSADKSMDKTLSLFSHLPPHGDPQTFEKEFSGVTLGGPQQGSAADQLHPEVLSLGLKYADGTVRGGNARCRAMLRAFQSLLQDYHKPPGTKDIRHDLDHRIIKPAFQHWTARCRPHSVSMGNAFTFLKVAVANLDRDMETSEAVEVLCDTIDAYVQERIDFADRAISEYASSKIVDDDVLLTFGRSEVIDVLLRDAAAGGRGGGGGNARTQGTTTTKKKKRFRVIVVDSRPLLEGRSLLRRLVDAGIECTYILLNSLSYVMMREVTKVFLGAAALMSDGSVLSRVGTACVALLARSCNVPVLVCCETYKIKNRVQLESITGNELGNPDDVVSTSCAMGDSEEAPGRSVVVSEKGVGGSGTAASRAADRHVLADWRNVPNLKLLNLLYDLTPSEFVSGIVSEMGILPPTSVAVLLREMNPQDNDSALGI